MRFLIKILSCLLPWKLKRLVLIYYFKFDIHPKANIGLAWVFPSYLQMDEYSKIDHFTVAVNLDKIVLGKQSTIGRKNWITGFPTKTNSAHFKHQTERVSELVIGINSAITKNHHIDCTNSITIGSFVTIAGYYSQLLTHSINVFDNRQDSMPISIGDYCFIGTNVVILGGSNLPSYSVLGAKSLLNKTFTEEWKLYGGNPAKPIKEIPKDAQYFTRTSGYVI